MASTIILKNGTGSAIPSTLIHGEPAINVNTGLFYYGSGSAGIVKTLSNFTDITASLSASLGGNISASGYVLGKNIIATGNVSASGNIVATGFISSSGRIQTLSHITASGNISSSGTIIANKIESDELFSRVGDANTGIQLGSDTVKIEGNDIVIANFTPTQIQLNKPITTHITASGNIEATSYISASEFRTTGHITASGNISSSGTVTGLSGSFDYVKTNKLQVQLLQAVAVSASGNISATGHITSSGRIQTLSHITASGNISASGTIYSDEYRIGLINFASVNGNILTVGNSGANPIILGRANTTPIYLSGDVTSSSHISSSGTITGRTLVAIGNISASGNISATGHITSSGRIQTLSHITASGNISSSGTIIGSSVVNKKALHFLYTTNKFTLDTSDELYFSLSDADRDIGAGSEDQVGVMAIVPLTGILKHVIINTSSDLSSKSWEFKVYRVPSGADADSGGKILMATVASNAGPASHTSKKISFVTNTADTNVISYETGYNATTMFTASDRIILSLESNSDATGSPKINSVLCFELDESTI